MERKYLFKGLVVALIPFKLFGNFKPEVSWQMIVAYIFGVMLCDYLLDAIPAFYTYITTENNGKGKI